MCYSNPRATHRNQNMSGSDFESDDSDRELQVALEQGLIKPGLNIEAEAPQKFINNVAGLQQALQDLQKTLPWQERLDLTTDLAPAPHGVGLNEEDEDTVGDMVHDDFRREMRFYRQAQKAVQVGLPRLRKLNIPTHRPNDYFAEMAKSDEHMKKVREKLLSKQMSMERSEKARKLRELRKYGKKVQQEVLLNRQKEKKQMLDAVKKYRKGKVDKLDFLDEKRSGGKAGTQAQDRRPNKKREYKNKKFGFGGQKKRSKYNTATSSKDMSDFKSSVHSNKKRQPKKSASQARPGKRRRQKIKNKKK